MELLTAIYQRRAVRDYTSEPVSLEAVRLLIEAAIQAPTALDEQLWAFLVVQGRPRLRDYSDRAKAHFLETFSPGRDPHSARHDILRDPDYNLFYNAGTLVAVCARPGGQFNTIDCCLAAENLMLAAFGMGLGTCPVGFSQSWLDQTETKAELGVPPDYTVVLPIIVGHPAAVGAGVRRQPPEVYYCPPLPGER